MPVRQSIELVGKALHDKTLSPKTLAFKMVVQCRRAVQLATAEAITSGRRDGVDTPGLEWYLVYMWLMFLYAAEEDASRLDFFVDVLVAVRSRYNEDTEWIFRGQPFDWSNLDDQWPCWGLAIAEVMHTTACYIPDADNSEVRSHALQHRPGALRRRRRLHLSVRCETGPILAGDPPPDTPEGRGWARGRARWLNRHMFHARLWALGIYADPDWAMMTVAGHLESLALPEDVWRSKPDDVIVPRELDMEAGMIWLRVAGARMFMCRKVWGRDSKIDPGRSRGTWKGVAGYHPDRWAHWKDILRALVEGEKGEWRPNVMEAAKVSIASLRCV
ncbi:hypothetical protein TRAPUB_11218 [Trametes pubescens]|uniref:Uncharacterized protein n=1 Tax=Trametes pubescens TaxID=154538 RepID=A0A1M2VXH7_TRAPU|nr:hypothetical protein TRAPUB_11218 [Trametes pubescens]